VNLTSRVAVAADFSAIYPVLFREPFLSRNPSIPPDFHEAVEHEWHTTMRCPTTLAMLVLDEDRPEGQRIVGIGQAVFVSDAFVAWARSGLMGPWVNARVTQPMPDGSWPLLDLTQVRAANSGDGLNVLLAHWATSLLPTDEVHLVRAYMGRESLRFYRGYNFKEMLVETLGDEARRRALSSGLFLRSDYSAHYQTHPPLPSPERRPYLLGVTRDEALADEGSLISHVFVYAPPRLFFKPHEQEMLLLALEHAADERIAEALDLTVGAVKRRWLAIYRRVEDVLPGLLPGSNDEVSARGPEKRRILLRYLVDHLEELRPINRPSPAPPAAGGAGRIREAGSPPAPAGKRSGCVLARGGEKLSDRIGAD
jgi:hypothetical protein